jgi:hypothetical protein
MLRFSGNVAGAACDAIACSEGGLLDALPIQAKREKTKPAYENKIIEIIGLL